MSEFKSGFVAIVGRPNVGKSTLLNRLSGEKIAIVSSRPQTTRGKILSIVNGESYQAVFVDTPGIHQPRTKLGELMNEAVSEAASDVDAVIMVVEAGRVMQNNEEKIARELFEKGAQVILAINKVDKAEKEKLLPQIASFDKLGGFRAIIPVSALKGEGVDLVMKEILSLLPEGPRYYPQDMITDQTERQMAAEIVREKLLRLLDKEVPHGIAVEIEEMKDEEALVRIGAVIYCEKESHKQIIIGKGGEMLKRVGSGARGDLEKLLDKKVYLSLWVKVKTDWRNSKFMLKSFGFEG